MGILSDITNGLIALLDRLFTKIGTFNDVDLFAIAIFMVFWVWVWRNSANKQDTYALIDVLKDPYSNRASSAALVYIGFAGLSAWYIVRVLVAGGDPSGTLLAVLGIFIAKAGADRAISAWGTHKAQDAPPTDPPTPRDDLRAPDAVPASVVVVPPDTAAALKASGLK